MYGSLVVTLSLLLIAVKINLNAISFGLVSIVGVRVAVTFLLFHLVESEAQYFDSIDPELLFDSIPFTVIFLFMAICNWKFDLLTTVPLMTFTSLVGFHRAYSVQKENDDMSECKAAENTADTLSQRWIAYVLFFLVFAYNMRYIIMQRFLEQQLSKK